MKLRNLLAESTTLDGARMSLYEHDGAYSISFQGQELMHSKASASELLLSKLGIELVRKEPRPRVMIGGLGLGFTGNEAGDYTSQLQHTTFGCEHRFILRHNALLNLNILE